ncbi:MAG: DUF2461 domain-containing protein [Rhodospirillales bacterium]|jgi:uncharacterized protein (TIGR02453 family)|nr:DUF2461 domain-containing protein [Rhodospirillales bacterium]MDP6643387.1 DUF2461 domain-containing protein [Rhodospirillales bacterium]MDP6840635.1 DUF2461 domain-containing protein [Rhodospirillales bacterium]|tara:strand:+ start:391 stop:1086 length:696 start_codon:yes stop_codon:yes gene_type:complete
MSQDFKGLSGSFFDFFTELAANNERPWFNANKDRYREDVVAPIVALISALAPRLEKISKQFVADPRPNGGSMFRIYRDVRFAKDKRPYKEHAACQFRHSAGRDAHAPGFYIHLAPDEVIFGGGMWMPPPPQLKSVRDAIAKDVSGWRRVRGNKRLKDTFGGIAGDGLTRPPKGFDAEHPLIDDIKRKSFFAMRHEKPRIAASAKFIDEVEATFKAASPLMRFLCRAVDADF